MLLISWCPFLVAIFNGVIPWSHSYPMIVDFSHEALGLFVNGAKVLTILVYHFLAAI